MGTFLCLLSRNFFVGVHVSKIASFITVRWSSGGSSQRWLKRQRKDKYVKQAHTDSYRCRSAFKLIELDDQLRFLKPGINVIDCGAAPGSWTQVVVERVNKPLLNAHDQSNTSKNIVISFDLKDIQPVEGATIFSNTNFLDTKSRQKILNALPGGRAHVVLSDMAPNASGNAQMDHDNLLDLAYSVFDFSKNALRMDGSMVCKVYDGKGMTELVSEMKLSFGTVRLIKPEACRKESRELYVCGLSFR